LIITHAQGISVETDMISNMSAQEILKLVQELAPSYRMVFNLYVVEGYKHREVAEKLGIIEATSRATFATARWIRQDSTYTGHSKMSFETKVILRHKLQNLLSIKSELVFKRRIL
jgi:FixJ family two-component response regulator